MVVWIVNTWNWKMFVCGDNVCPVVDMFVKSTICNYELLYVFTVE